MNDFWKSILKGAAVAGAGAVLAYVSQAATSLDPNWGPAIAAVAAVAVNILRKWSEGNGDAKSVS